MDERNLFLDYVRAVACILVILFHYTKRFDELFHTSGNWPVKVSWGTMAVSVFFLLSGYLITVKNDEKTGLIAFVKKRIIRLYPDYIVAVVITFIVTSLFLHERQVSLKEALINLTMLETFFDVKYVDGAYWTLANELVFYLFFILVVFLLKKKNWLPFFGLAWVILLLIYNSYNGNSAVYVTIGRLLANQYGHMFVVGLGVAFILHDMGNKIEKAAALIAVLAALVYQFVIFNVFYFIFFSVSVLMLIGCIIAHIKNIRVSEKVKKVLYPLEIIAGISYPLYLLHQNIGYAIMLQIQKHICNSEVIIIIPCIVSVVLAYIFNKYIDKKISQLK